MLGRHGQLSLLDLSVGDQYARWVVYQADHPAVPAENCDDAVRDKEFAKGDRRRSKGRVL